MATSFTIRVGLGITATLFMTQGCTGGDAEPSASGTGAETSGDSGSNPAGSSESTSSESASPESASSGSSSPSTGPDDTGMDSTGVPTDGPMPILGDCDGLGGLGEFQNITPPELLELESFHVFAIATDPVHQGTLYVGTLEDQKLWKSTDCGANWVHISTGDNGDVIDAGMNWTLVVDAEQPEIVYTNSGYGAGGSGLHKSLNGGVDWETIWPPPNQPELAEAFTYNFANVLTQDPQDSKHLVLTFHELCLAPHPDVCIAETLDGGQTWTLFDGHPSWEGWESQVIYFLDDDQTWLWGSQLNGFWRTEDGGGSWTEIPGMRTSHLQGSQSVATPSGAYLVATIDGIWRSADGQADSWTNIPDTGPIVGGLVRNGDALFASTCYFGNFCDRARFLTSTDDGVTWSEMEGGPDIPMGGTMAIDLGHQVLYSSNGASGVWRVVVGE